ncbi:unnamed protein product [Lota lota]
MKPVMSQGFVVWRGVSAHRRVTEGQQGSHWRGSGTDWQQALGPTPRANTQGMDNLGGISQLTCAGLGVPQGHLVEAALVALLAPAPPDLDCRQAPFLNVDAGAIRVIVLAWTTSPEEPK